MKLKNNQKGVAHLAAILAVVLVVAVGLVGWKVYDTTKSNTSDFVSTNTDTKASNLTVEDEFLNISEWGVKFPVTQVGKFSTAASSTAAAVGPMSPEGLEDKSIVVNGFTSAENNCTLPFDAAQIYRHAEEDPEIKYTTTFKLSSIAPTKVKVGDYWYSLKLPVTDGNCFEGKTVPDDYKKLASELVEDFTKLEQL